MGKEGGLWWEKGKGYDWEKGECFMWGEKGIMDGEKVDCYG